MWNVADPNASHRDRTPDDDLRPRETEPPPEIIDAEVVDEVVTEPPRSRPSTPQDDEAFREYQRFLEFQKFQEWQRQQGGTGGEPPTGTPPPTRTATPWWKRLLRLLRYKLVRRLVYLVVVLLILGWLLSSLTGAGSGGGGDAGSGTGGAPPNSTPITSTNPKAAIRGVYNYVAHKPDTACALFDDSGKSAFAYAYGVPTCEEAARRAHSQVTAPGPYANPKFGPEAIKELPDEVVVDSCLAEIQGGPALGTFQLGRASDGGWIINNYASPRC